MLSRSKRDLGLTPFTDNDNWGSSHAASSINKEFQSKSESPVNLPITFMILIQWGLLGISNGKNARNLLADCMNISFHIAWVNRMDSGTLLGTLSYKTIARFEFDNLNKHQLLWEMS